MRISGKMLACGCIWALAAGACLETARASLAPVDQFRVAAARTHVDVGEASDEEDLSEAATDFGPFNLTVAAQVMVAGESGNSAATQDSTLGASQISAAGSASGSIFTSTFIEEGDGDALSIFQYTFTVDEADFYLFSASLLNENGVGDFEASASIHFKGVSGDIVPTLEVEGNGSADFPATPLFLDAGEYFIFAQSSIVLNAADSMAQSSFELNLTLVPEPATLAVMMLAVPVLFRRRRQAA